MRKKGLLWSKKLWSERSERSNFNLYRIRRDCNFLSEPKGEERKLLIGINKKNASFARIKKNEMDIFNSKYLLGRSPNRRQAVRQKIKISPRKFESFQLMPLLSEVYIPVIKQVEHLLLVSADQVSTLQMLPSVLLV